MSPVRILLLLSLSLLLLLPFLAAEEAATDPPTETDPVDEDLRGLAPPWYDAERDSWQRVEFKEDESRSDGGFTIDTGDATGLGTLAQMLLVAFIGALLIALVYWILRNIRPVPAGGLEVHGGPDRPPPDISLLPFSQAIDRDPEAGLAAAIAREDWRLAVIYLYACQLFFLDQRGIIHLHPGKTNRGYLREIPGGRAELRRSLVATVSAFERVYFGGHDIDRSGFEALRTRDRELRAAGEESRS